ncbi:MAG TPA: DUF192 domain-containing protein [Spirochaetota bacterium]|nr:DUF192 domain-containing protein [Spirochaetota bacterium]HOR43711.1 DUF192 domain-containing protein [Spirochaetota bacterium]HPK55234.1 DUF192 domain-containing protein [Spirochaetota bacterium]HQE60343.1 DUF192 domain-containing protein [Spirochaetota bacterium]HQE60346.1 DUF192 domain-containing protein [Spirochaetota bacterium]
MEKRIISVRNSSGAVIKIQVEIAQNNAERTRGLMGRSGLDSGSGMLFIFPREQYLNFWMKNVSFPLSIAYIDSKGKILQITDMKENNDVLTYPSRNPARYALEVNKGFFEKNQIVEGCFVDIRSYGNK